MKTQMKITFAIMVALTLSVGLIGCSSSAPPKGPDTPTEHGDPTEDPTTGKKLGS
ncbi:MAG: hypothetical protein ABI614_03010 [Planctomycetota bacterium]